MPVSEEVSKNVYDEAVVVQRQYISDLTAFYEQTTDLNKRMASAFERVMLIDLGTIALSTSAVISLASRDPMHNSLRILFAMFVILGWISLLGSAFVSRYEINRTITSSADILTVLRRDTTRLFHLTAGRWTESVGKRMERGSASEKVIKFGLDLQENFFKPKGSMEQTIANISKSSSYSAAGSTSVPVSLMMLGLVCLCSSAIVLLLAV